MTIGNDWIGFYKNGKDFSDDEKNYCLTIYPFTFTYFKDPMHGKGLEIGIFKLYISVRIGEI
jgi:hypothetical protein